MAAMLHPLYRLPELWSDTFLSTKQSEYVGLMFTEDDQLEIDKEFTNYMNGIGASFTRAVSLRKEVTKTPLTWWHSYGRVGLPILSRLALRILSQGSNEHPAIHDSIVYSTFNFFIFILFFTFQSCLPLSTKQDCWAGACERNWSAYSLIHTKIRNRLSTSQLEKLAYCRANMRLVQSYHSLGQPKQILCRSNDNFCFSNGSIGNFFFAGARIFFQSLDAAIFLFSRVSQIPINSFVLPAICTNDRLTLGCELQDGTIIRGQNEISHPSSSSTHSERFPQCALQLSSKLPASIKRIFYMSSEGTNLLHEVFPAVNPTVLEHLKQAQAIIYGMGSLFTSICPSLVLYGVGEVIADQTCLKILILNSTHDRESYGMSASDFVVSICNALNRKHGDSQKSLNFPATAYINCMLVPKGGAIRVDMEKLLSLGVNKVVTVGVIKDDKGGLIYEPRALIQALKQAIVS
ncbi:hypothetical protein L7F22_026572 [Adiantum nelumboides]|nr:hypothetical protein [Adiantum nelumboides]